MKVIVWDQSQSTSEVLKIELLQEETLFHLADGQVLRVGESPHKLQAQLNRSKEISGIDLSAPSSAQCTIFYAPFMARAVYDVAWSIVRTHPKVQKAFRGHPSLQAVTQLGYDELLLLPLIAYVADRSAFIWVTHLTSSVEHQTRHSPMAGTNADATFVTETTL